MLPRVLAHRPSPAMVVACVALVVALGGTSYAAIKLPRNSVGNAQIRNSAVTGAKVRDGSLQAKVFASSALVRGPRGPEGPAGASGGGSVGASGSRIGFASRDIGGAPLPLTPIATYVDVLDIAVPAGSSGYGASSGNIAVAASSRLVAVANVTIHSDPSASTIFCRFLLSGNETLGTPSNGNLAPNSHLSITITGGADIEPGLHNVRVQCSAQAGGFTVHRGNLTVVVTPR